MSDPEPVFKAIARILAVRLHLLLSLLGDFSLAVIAMTWQSPIALLIMIAFAGLTTLPLVLLEWLGRSRG